MVFGLALLAFALSGCLAKALVTQKLTVTIKLYKVNCDTLVWGSRFEAACTQMQDLVPCLGSPIKSR